MLACLADESSRRRCTYCEMRSDSASWGFDRRSPGPISAVQEHKGLSELATQVILRVHSLFLLCFFVIKCFKIIGRTSSTRSAHCYCAAPQGMTISQSLCLRMESPRGPHQSVAAEPKRLMASIWSFNDPLPPRAMGMALASPKDQGWFA